MEEEKKIIAIQDTTGGLKSQAERDLYKWINENPEEAANWLKSLSQTKPEQPKKKKLFPRLKTRPQMIFPNSLKIREPLWPKNT